MRTNQLNMKKAAFLFCLFVNALSANAQTAYTKTGNTASTNQPVNDSLSDWLFIQSGKALQYRFKLVKRDGDVSHFQVQLRIDFDDQVFCRHDICQGYLLALGYPTLDNQKTVETSYRVYNTFKGVYIIPEAIPVRLNFSDGSKRMLRPGGFVYTTADNNTEQTARVFSGCVDIMLSNDPDNHRCKRDFDPSAAIVIK